MERLSFTYNLRWILSNGNVIASLSKLTVVTLQTFSFSQVSLTLAEMHSVAPEKISAFQGRLKHYQKQGFPSGINTGRGRAATYYIHHILQLGIALELNQFGLNPERAIRICLSNMDRIRSALNLAASSLEHGPRLPMFVYFNPANLADLADPDDPDDADESFHYAGIGQLRENLDQWTEGYLRRVALINVTEMQDEMVHRLALQTGREENTLLKAVLDCLQDDEMWQNDQHPQT